MIAADRAGAMIVTSGGRGTRPWPAGFSGQPRAADTHGYNKRLDHNPATSSRYATDADILVRGLLCRAGLAVADVAV